MHQTGYNNMTINQSNKSLIIRKPIPEYKRGVPEILVKEVPQEGAQASAYGPFISSISNESILH
jgi:hypothetical protein